MEHIPQPKDYLHKIEILRLVAQQIEKDFGEASLEIEITDKPEDTFPDILSQMADQIKVLIDLNPANFFQLLYRIDLSENKIKKAITEDQRDAKLVIAEQILLREMQKVLFRLQYSNNPAHKALLNIK